MSRDLSDLLEHDYKHGLSAYDMTWLVRAVKDLESQARKGLSSHIEKTLREAVQKTSEPRQVKDE